LRFYFPEVSEMLEIDDFTYEFHWLMDMLQTIDVGLCVLDKDLKVKVWNGFMENHSGLRPEDIKDQNLFDVMPNLPETWLRQKTKAVFLLGTRTFTTWEQRPYLFPFKNYRPVTGVQPHMFQNVTFTPLKSVTGEIDHVCLIVYDVTDVATHKKSLLGANETLAHLSRTDGLTKLNNRACWEEHLVNQYSRYRRYKGECCVVMFDIDHFKKVNDTYGHPAGDEAIRAVSATLLEHARETDIAGRYGGEEFGIILPETGEEGAVIMCERLRLAIEAIRINHDGHSFQFTVSLGVSVLDKSFTDYNQWLASADQALYLAKDEGRNQTRVFSSVK